MLVSRRLFLASTLAWPLTPQSTPAQYPPIPDWVGFDANLQYGERKHNVLDVFYPRAQTKKKRPGVVVIHGGGWVAGTKEGDWKWHVLNYLEHGFVVANVEYRLADIAPAPAAVEDALMAAAYFRRGAKRWNVDQKQIVATGGSAGGHLALMVGLTPGSAKLGPTGDIAAVVNFCGITDVEDLVQGANPRDWAQKWVPDGPDRLDLARRVSPITYAGKDSPPVLTIHGTEDDVVPYVQAVRLTKELRDAGTPAELIPLPGFKHSPYEETQRVYPQVFDWLARRGITVEKRS